MPADSCLLGRKGQFPRFICTLWGPQSLGRLLLIRLCSQIYCPVMASLSMPPLMRPSLSGSFTKIITMKLPQVLTLSWFLRKAIPFGSTKSSLSVKSTNPLMKISSGTISRCKEFRLNKMMGSLMMSKSVSTPQNCLAQVFLLLAQWQTCPRKSVLDGWDWFESGTHKSIRFLLTCCKAKSLGIWSSWLTFSKS